MRLYTLSIVCCLSCPSTGMFLTKFVLAMWGLKELTAFMPARKIPDGLITRLEQSLSQLYRFARHGVRL